MFATDSFMNAEVTYREGRVRRGWATQRPPLSAPPRPGGRRAMSTTPRRRTETGGPLSVGGDTMTTVSTSRSTDLVGRDAELEELISRLGIRASAAGPGRDSRAVLLAGDAGVGKTRLLTELRDVAVAEGWFVLAGHCLDLADGSLPYLPFSEILGRVLTDRPEVAASVTERHPTLARLQPGRRLRAADDRDEDQSLDRGNIFAAVHDLLETMAEGGPLLVVVEDTHWADQSTRDMLSFLFSRPFAGPVSLVVSYRSDDLHRRHPLRPQVAEWARLRGVERIQVEPLTDGDVRQLVYSMHQDSTLPEASVAEIVDRAEGNAFFVEELVGATWATGGQIPAELADVLLVRLDGLDDRTLEVVRVASVAGRHVSHELLAAVTGLGPPSSRAPSARPWSPTCWSRPAVRPTPSGTPSSARRSTTTCCPASARACTPPSRPRCSPAGSPAPPPSSPCTRVGPATG